MDSFCCTPSSILQTQAVRLAVYLNQKNPSLLVKDTKFNLCLHMFFEMLGENYSEFLVYMQDELENFKGLVMSTVNPDVLTNAHVTSNIIKVCLCMLSVDTMHDSCVQQICNLFPILTASTQRLRLDVLCNVAVTTPLQTTAVVKPSAKAQQCEPSENIEALLCVNSVLCALFANYCANPAASTDAVAKLFNSSFGDELFEVVQLRLTLQCSLVRLVKLLMLRTQINNSTLVLMLVKHVLVTYSEDCCDRPNANIVAAIGDLPTTREIDAILEGFMTFIDCVEYDSPYVLLVKLCLSQRMAGQKQDDSFLQGVLTRMVQLPDSQHRYLLVEQLTLHQEMHDKLLQAASQMKNMPLMWVLHLQQIHQGAVKTAQRLEDVDQPGLDNTRASVLLLASTNFFLSVLDNIKRGAHQTVEFDVVNDRLSVVKVHESPLDPMDQVLLDIIDDKMSAEKFVQNTRLLVQMLSKPGIFVSLHFVSNLVALHKIKWSEQKDYKSDPAPLVAAVCACVSLLRTDDCCDMRKNVYSKLQQLLGDLRESPAMCAQVWGAMVDMYAPHATPKLKQVPDFSSMSMAEPVDVVEYLHQVTSFVYASRSDGDDTCEQMCQLVRDVVLMMQMDPFREQIEAKDGLLEMCTDLFRTCGSCNPDLRRDFFLALCLSRRAVAQATGVAQWSMLCEAVPESPLSLLAATSLIESLRSTTCNTTVERVLHIMSVNTALFVHTALSRNFCFSWLLRYHLHVAGFTTHVLFLYLAQLQLSAEFPRLQKTLLAEHAVMVKNILNKQPMEIAEVSESTTLVVWMDETTPAPRHYDAADSLQAKICKLKLLSLNVLTDKGFFEKYLIIMLEMMQSEPELHSRMHVTFFVELCNLFNCVAESFDLLAASSLQQCSNPMLVAFLSLAQVQFDNSFAWVVRENDLRGECAQANQCSAGGENLMPPVRHSAAIAQVRKTHHVDPTLLLCLATSFKMLKHMQVHVLVNYERLLDMQIV